MLHIDGKWRGTEMKSALQLSISYVWYHIFDIQTIWALHSRYVYRSILSILIAYFQLHYKTKLCYFVFVSNSVSCKPEFHLKTENNPDEPTQTQSESL